MDQKDLIEIIGPTFDILMDYEAIGAETVKEAQNIILDEWANSQKKLALSPVEEAILKNLNVDKTRL